MRVAAGHEPVRHPSPAARPASALREALSVQHVSGCGTARPVPRNRPSVQ